MGYTPCSPRVSHNEGLTLSLSIHPLTCCLQLHTLVYFTGCCFILTVSLVLPILEFFSPMAVFPIKLIFIPAGGDCKYDS